MDVARARLRNQRLVGAPLSSPAGVVAHLGAVQAQDLGGALWALGQRAKGATEAGVTAAYDAGAFVRVHAMRPTWHFVAPADLRWLQALTAARVHASSARYRAQLGLDAKKLARLADAAARAVRGTALTRNEIGARIGVTGQALAHVMMYAELELLVCSGPMKGKQTSYAAVDERVPPARALTRDEALVELARRYFASHGPATAQDFAWWSGMAAADAKAAVDAAADVARTVVDGRTWLGAHDARRTKGAPVAHLLPNYDELLVAYRDRSATIHASVLSHAGGDVLFTNAIAVDGVVVGGWRRTRTGRAVELETMTLTALGAGARAAVAEAAARYGRFLGLPVVVKRAAGTVFRRGNAARGPRPSG